MAAMNLEFWRNGPQPGALYNFPGTPTASYDHPITHTQSPVTTGSSVLGIKFNGGVAIAADMLGSYGSLARFRNVTRVMKVNDSTILGAGGDYADFQHLRDIIEQSVNEDQCMDDGFNMTPKSLFSWLTRVLYNRRSKFDPLWNTVIVGGIQKGEPFLGTVNKIGMAFETPTTASGYGAYIALPMLREAYEKNSSMTEEEALKLLDRCLKVLFYRDARSFNKYEVVICTSEGSKIIGPLSSETNWDISSMVKGYE